MLLKKLELRDKAILLNTANQIGEDMHIYVSSKIYLLILSTLFFTVGLSTVTHAGTPEKDTPMPGRKLHKYPTIQYVDAYLEPFKARSPRVIGGTQFPWSDRFGNQITVGQRFLVHGAKNRSGIEIAPRALQVYFAGNPCKVTIPDPSSKNVPNSARWDYFGAPISLGSVPANVAHTVAYQWIDGTILNDSNGNAATNTYTFNVCQVLPTRGTDTVNTLSPIYFDGDATYANLNSHNPIAFSSTQAREIKGGFTVSCPIPVSADGITVGIIQSLTNGHVLGVIPYHRVTPGGSLPVTGELIFSSSQPLPLFDSYEVTPSCFPFYSADCFAVAPSGSGKLWNGGPFDLIDSPLSNFSEYTQSQAGSTYNYDYGKASGNPSLGPNSCQDVFEDMLTAFSPDAPNIFVPIFGYKVWEVDFSGTYVSGTWTGGGVSIVANSTSTAPVADTTRGPSNTVVKNDFTAP